MLSTPSTWGIVEKRNELNKVFTFTFLYLHLYMYVRCMDIYLDTLVDFYQLEAKSKNFIDFISLFRNAPR